MQTEVRAGCLELNRAGLAVIKEAGVLVGDVLILTFMWGWSVDDLLAYYPELTQEMVNAAYEYAAERPETPEGLFYFSVEIFPLLAAAGWL